MENWKKKAIIMGAAIGMAAGVVSALILIKQAEEKKKPIKISFSNGAKAGIALLDTIKKLA